MGDLRKIRSKSFVIFYWFYLMNLFCPSRDPPLFLSHPCELEAKDLCLASGERVDVPASFSDKRVIDGWLWYQSLNWNKFCLNLRENSDNTGPLPTNSGIWDFFSPFFFSFWSFFIYLYSRLENLTFSPKVDLTTWQTFKNIWNKEYSTFYWNRRPGVYICLV